MRRINDIALLLTVVPMTFVPICEVTVATTGCAVRVIPNSTPTVYSSFSATDI